MVYHGVRCVVDDGPIMAEKPTNLFLLDAASSDKGARLLLRNSAKVGAVQFGDLSPWVTSDKCNFLPLSNIPQAGAVQFKWFLFEWCHKNAIFFLRCFTSSSRWSIWGSHGWCHTNAIFFLSASEDPCRICLIWEFVSFLSLLWCVPPRKCNVFLLAS